MTYFFSGGREQPYEGEDRKLVPSPRDVATYDLKPEMSAAGVADAVVEAIQSGAYDFILVNFANPDMVGHTGKLDPAIHAVEAVDAGLGAIMNAVRAAGGALLVTSDHGNCEQMKDAKGGPHTAHTTNPVPLYYLQRGRPRRHPPPRRAHLRRRPDHARSPRHALARGHDGALADRPLSSPSVAVPDDSAPREIGPLRDPRDGGGARVHRHLPRRAAPARPHGAGQDAQVHGLRQLALRRRAGARSRRPGAPRPRGHRPPLRLRPGARPPLPGPRGRPRRPARRDPRRHPARARGRRRHRPRRRPRPRARPRARRGAPGAARRRGGRRPRAAG